MSLSFDTQTYAGGVQTFPISFALGYGDRTNVQVYVVGELDGAGDQLYRDFTWNSDSEILVTAALTVGDSVRLQRTVSKTTLVADYTQPGSATRQNLQATATQAMMAIHEFIDGRVDSLPSDHPSFIALAAAEAAAEEAVVSAAAAAASEAGVAADATTAADAAVLAGASATATELARVEVAANTLAVAANTATVVAVAPVVIEAADAAAIDAASALDSAQEATAAASTASAAVAATTSAGDAAALNFIALGEALSNVLSAFTLSTEGNLVVSYNSTVITNIEIDGTGHLLIEYEV